MPASVGGRQTSRDSPRGERSLRAQYHLQAVGSPELLSPSEPSSEPSLGCHLATHARVRAKLGTYTTSRPQMADPSSRCHASIDRRPLTRARRANILTTFKGPTSAQARNGSVLLSDQAPSTMLNDRSEGQGEPPTSPVRRQANNPNGNRRQTKPHRKEGISSPRSPNVTI